MDESPAELGEEHTRQVSQLHALLLEGTFTDASLGWVVLDLHGFCGEVELDLVSGVEEPAGVVGVDAAGAAVVDEEREAVRGEPDVAAESALA